MRITKFGHACVRLEHDGHVLVLDPGVFTEPEAVDGATAVLVTHEHADHISPDLLRATDAPVFTVAAVAESIRKDAPDVVERMTIVGPGDQFDVGLPVTAVGELHAVIHPDYPRFLNSGYVITAGEQRVYHPGDSFTTPPVRVDVCLVPVSGPWLKTSESIDFARAVKAPVNVAIHDRIYSEAGLATAGIHLTRFLGESGQEYRHLKDGEDL